MAFGNVPQPTSDSERAALARRTKKEFQLDVDIWLDDLSDQSRQTFGDLPNWAIVIAPGGRIMHKLPWAEPDLLGRMVGRLAGRQQDKAWSKTLLDKTASANRRALANDQQAASKPPATATEQHIRSARLAWLVCHEPQAANRPRWLRELAATGPMRQRDWATQLLRACTPPPSPPSRSAEHHGEHRADR